MLFLSRAFAFVLVLALAAVGVLAAPLAPPSLAAEAAELSHVDRLAGPTRIGTAVAISEWSVREGTGTVVLSRADSYADALAGAPLAAMRRAPILLSESRRLSPETAEEIRRLGATTVVLLGGEAALGQEVVRQLGELGVTTVERLAGASRYDTAVRIAEALPTSADRCAFVVAGADPDPKRGWPDAVAVSGLAARTSAPILLTDRSSLPAATADGLRGLGVGCATIVGGLGSVSANVERAIVALGMRVDRLAGATRYETSLLVARRTAQLVGPGDTVVIATGRSFPDALSAGPLAARLNGTLLLVDGGNLAGAEGALRWLAETAFRRAVLTGGPQAISTQAAATLDDLLAATPPPPPPEPASPAPSRFDPRAHDWGTVGRTDRGRRLTDVGAPPRVVVSEPGTVLEGVRSARDVEIRVEAAGAVLRECELNSHVRVNDHAAGPGEATTIERCDVFGYGHGMMGMSFTARHNYISTGHDGIRPTGGSPATPTLIEYNRLERDGTQLRRDGQPKGPAGPASEGRHHDGIQFWQGGHATIRRNWISGWQTSAIIIKSDRAPISDILIEENYLANPTGHWIVYVREGNHGHGRPQMITIRNNAFGSSRSGIISSGPNPSSQAVFVRSEAERRTAIDAGDPTARDWIVWYGNHHADTGEEIIPPGGWRTP